MPVYCVYEPRSNNNPPLLARPVGRPPLLPRADDDAGAPVSPGAAPEIAPHAGRGQDVRERRGRVRERRADALALDAGLLEGPRPPILAHVQAEAARRAVLGQASRARAAPLRPVVRHRSPVFLTATTYRPLLLSSLPTGH